MLRFEAVSKSFGKLRALDGLSLSIEPGEVFGLLGPNGAGKTTSISIAVGLTKPDAGSVRLAGVGSPHEHSARALLGVAPQSLAIYDDLTAEENLALLGGLYGLKRRERKLRAAQLLERVGLQDRAKHRVQGFSGGMKRRLNLAAAIVHSPKLVLLDEPTAGVDPQSRNALFDIVRSLQQDEITVVYTTHYMEEAQKLCDRVGIIDKGRLLALDTVDGLIRRYASPRDVYRDYAIPEPPSHEIKPAFEAEHAMAGSTGSDLESVFLEITGKRLRD